MLFLNDSTIQQINRFLAWISGFFPVKSEEMLYKASPRMLKGLGAITIGIICLLV